MQSKWGLPAHKHNCSVCKFLGQFTVAADDGSTRVHDLYYCDKCTRHPTVSYRYGDEDADVVGAVIRDELEDPILVEAVVRATITGYNTVSDPSPCISEGGLDELMGQLVSLLGGILDEPPKPVLNNDEILANLTENVSEAEAIAFRAFVKMPFEYQKSMLMLCSTAPASALADFAKLDRLTPLVMSVLMHLGATMMAKHLFEKHLAGEKTHTEIDETGPSGPRGVEPSNN